MRPGPDGAQCALHSGISANFVCARCGNFMCASCALNGAEPQCPTCRDLNPVGFPYDGHANLSTLWSHTASSFSREAAMCILGGIILLVFSAGGSIVATMMSSVVNSIFGFEPAPGNPFASLESLSKLGASFVVGQVLGLAVTFVVQGIAQVGFYRMLMDVLVGKKADLSRMFSQLHLLPSFVAMQVIIFFVVTLPTFVFLGVVGWVGSRMVGLDWSRLSSFRWEKLLNPAFLGLLGASSLVVIVVSVVMLPLTLFGTPELIVGQCGPVEALKRGWDLGSGQRLRLFGYSIVAAVVVFAGLIACFVGVVVAMPLAFMLVLALFLALRKNSSFPAEIYT